VARGDGKPARHQNLLDGRTWTRYSISIWGDIRKSPEELALDHPAMFPVQLADRLVEIFTRQDGELVLDPFCGSGTVLLAALRRGCSAFGMDLSADYLDLAARRLRQAEGVDESRPFSFCLVGEDTTLQARLVRGDALGLLQYVEPESVDLCITSPPYWDILNRRRSADRKDVRNYGDDERDLGNIHQYGEFLTSLQDIFRQVHASLRVGAMCIVVVMDIRKKSDFYPLHIDLVPYLREVGFTLDDIIVWDRRQEYNNLRPLGYPWVFRVNKVHEFLLLFQKRGGEG